MKSVTTILFLFVANLLWGQASTIISGTIVDENGKPVEKAMVHYGGNPMDTGYADSRQLRMENGEWRMGGRNQPNGR